MAVTVGKKDLLSHFHGVEIDHFEGDVINFGLQPHRHEQRMMEPTGVPTGKHITSEGMKPRVSMYQRALASKSGASSTRCPSLVTWGGSSAGRWVSFTRMIWFGAL